MENKNQLQERKKNPDKRTRSLFLILLPSILIAMEGSISNIVLRIGSWVLTFLLQYVIIKGLLDDYYQYID